MLWGVPLSRILAKVEKPWLPWPVIRRFREFLSRMVYGRMEQWGFRTPKSRTHPASHPAIMGHIAWDRIRVKPGVASVAGNAVTFADGSTQTFDTMIAATGYEVELPFLSADVSPVVDAGSISIVGWCRRNGRTSTSSVSSTSAEAATSA